MEDPACTVHLDADNLHEVTQEEMVDWLMQETEGYYRLTPGINGPYRVGLTVRFTHFVDAICFKLRFK